MYFDNFAGGPINGATGQLLRIEPTGGATSTNQLVSNDFVQFDQNPVFQQSFIINSGIIEVPINFFVRDANVRTAEVELFNGNTGVRIAGPVVQSMAINNPNPTGRSQYIPLQFPISSDIQFDPGDFIRLRVKNITPQPGGTTQGTEFRIVNNTLGISQIKMQTDTVINIDSVGVFATAYPNTTQFSSYAPGTTVFIRTTVSDPFGNADITGSNVTITDSASVVQLNNTPMTVVDTPTGATKVFELQNTIPPIPQGIWQLDISAIEGSEGTVTDNAQIPMIVGDAAIGITKTSQVLSDPLNATNPKAIPGAIVEYTLTVNNSGFGFADNNTIVINDPLPTNTRLFFDSPVNPATFTDGVISSGLSFNFTTLGSTTDDIEFSNDGGVTTITPTIDASGLDITTPPINHIRLLPKGALRGSSDGINAPSFDLKFRVRIE